MKLIGGEGRESIKLLGMLNLPCQGFNKKTCTKIEANAGMTEQLVRDLAIEEALQEEIKDTLERNNQSYGEWCSQTDTKKITTRLNLLLHMTWAGRRDHLGGYMNPPVDNPSSSGNVERGSSEWSSIQRPAGNVMLRKR